MFSFQSLGEMYVCWPFSPSWNLCRARPSRVYFSFFERHQNAPTPTSKSFTPPSFHSLLTASIFFPSFPTLYNLSLSVITLPLCDALGRIGPRCPRDRSGFPHDWSLVLSYLSEKKKKSGSKFSTPSETNFRCGTVVSIPHCNS